jgi:sarcosine oxidase, subunit beta
MAGGCDAIVIGGGIVGLATAYHLSENGLKVIVLEKDFPGAGSTARCIGGIRQQFSSECAIRLMKESVGQFRQMKEKFGFSIDYFEGGYLFLAHSEKQMESYNSNLPLQQRLGLNVRILSAAECMQLVPQLNPEGLMGGVFSPEDGQAYPFKVLEGYIRQIRNNGSEVRPYEEVSGIRVEKGVVKGVWTQNGCAYSSDVVVSASGPWAAEVSRMVGVELPVFPEEHEAFITTRLPHLFDTMIVDYRANGCYFYQRTNGQVIGCYSPVPTKPGIHTESSLEFLVEMSKRTLRLVSKLGTARVIRHWGGCYPMTPDGNPIIDRTDIKGFYVAEGMCGHGFMFGPAVGKFLAGFIMDGAYPAEWSEFRIDRDFSGKERMQ